MNMKHMKNIEDLLKFSNVFIAKIPRLIPDWGYGPLSTPNLRGL